MNSTSPSQLLAAQHREIDRQMLAFKDGTEGLDGLRNVLTLLRLHLYVEEELLFPAVTTQALAMPLYILQYEHGQMWDFIERLAAACKNQSTATDAARDDCRKLLKLFKVHNPKEEDLVYAAADRAATTDPDNTLVSDIKAARLPNDWLCMAKRDDFAPPAGAPPWQPGPLPR